jgi:hypothetical protein
LVRIAIASGAGPTDSICGLILNLGALSHHFKPSPWKSGLPFEVIGEAKAVLKSILSELISPGMSDSEDKNYSRLHRQAVLSLLQFASVSDDLWGIDVVEVFWLLVHWDLTPPPDENPNPIGMDTGQSDPSQRTSNGFWVIFFENTFWDVSAVKNRHEFADAVSRSVTSSRILALPTKLADADFYELLSEERLDSLFNHFFMIGSADADPRFPATEHDRLITLSALIRAVSVRLPDPYRPSISEDSERKAPGLEILLTSWRERLASEKIGGGYPEPAAASYDEARNEHEDGDDARLTSGVDSDWAEFAVDQAVSPANAAETVVDVPGLIEFIDAELDGQRARIDHERRRERLSSTPTGA